MDIQYSSRTSERELAAGRSAADVARERGGLFASTSLPMALVAASALLALIVGVALPLPVLEGVLKEGSLVENATVVVYAFAMLAIWFVRDPALRSSVGRGQHRRYLQRALHAKSACAAGSSKPETAPSAARGRVSASLAVIVVRRLRWRVSGSFTGMPRKSGAASCGKGRFPRRCSRYFAPRRYRSFSIACLHYCPARACRSDRRYWHCPSRRSSSC